MQCTPERERGKTMPKQILFAVDGSSKCMQAAAGLAQLVHAQPDYHFLLYHCAPQQTNLRPGEIWDADSASELSERNQHHRADRFFADTISALTANGIAEDRIKVDIKYDSSDPGYDILSTAKQKGFQTIAVSRRGRSQATSLLLGSVSSRVAQYAEHKTVWVVDAPLNQTRRVLIAVEGAPECRILTYYAAEWLASIPDLSYTILHLLPPLPPTLWDDGHILEADEQSDREQEKYNWRSEWTRKVDKFMDEAKHALVQNGAQEHRIETRMQNVRQGVARDLLNELDRNQYQLVLIGKRSFQKKTPFLMGSHANKILFNAKAAILCLVDAN